MPKRLSEHLAGFHKMASENHSQLHDCYKSLSGFTKATKSEMKPDEQDSLCGTLDKIADCHKAAAAYHAKALDECTKAIAASDMEKRERENQLEPSRVSGVVPDRPTIQAVPRTGAKPMPVDFDSRPTQAIDFQKLSGIDELDNID
jgi:hypothetical protein